MAWIGAPPVHTCSQGLVVERSAFLVHGTRMCWAQQEVLGSLECSAFVVHGTRMFWAQQEVLGSLPHGRFIVAVSVLRTHLILVPRQRPPPGLLLSLWHQEPPRHWRQDGVVADPA